MTWPRVFVLLPLVAACAGGAAEQVSQERSFAALVADLSEPGGFFDTDNLISNEASYLHVVGGLRERGINGGAYIGVGPDQNFSYMAQVRPSVAFLIDIRRDNMLEHLIFKSLFALAGSRTEYLALLFARPPPADPAAWDTASIGTIVVYLDSSSTVAGAVDAVRARVDSTIRTFGVPLSPSDLRTIDRFHRTFIDAGLSLKFSSTGRAPRFYYPTYRDLLLERDLEGHHRNFLASEADFRFLKDLQARNRVIPVVGDLAGPRALRAIGGWLELHGEAVSAFYTSNVEFYLFRNGTFSRFAESVALLPIRDDGVIIRSVFRVAVGRHPLSVPGYYSTQLLQGLSDFTRGFAEGSYRSYVELVTLGAAR